MSEAIDAEGRLRAWIRDFGHLKEPPFIRDLTTVLDAFAFLRKGVKPTEKATPPQEHEFDSSWTCNYCGVAEEHTVRGEICPARIAKDLK